MPDDEVCDGCWKHGYCVRNYNPRVSCRCPCTYKGWRHADDPRNTQHRLE